MDPHPSRRQFVQGSAALAFGSFLTCRFPQLVFADEATATASDLSEFVVSITDGSITLSESTIPSGRYRVTIENASSSTDYLAAAFILLEGEATLDGINAALNDPTTQGPPPWYYTAWAPGGILVAPDSTAHAILDLKPGSYAVHPDTPGTGLNAVGLTVTGTFPSDPVAIVADNRLTLAEMSFTLDSPLTAQSQLIEIVNGGTQPHIVNIFNVPDGTTVDDFMALMSTFDDPPATPGAAATPVPALTFDNVLDYGGTTPQSPGTTMWASMTFDPGTYLLACWVNDPGTQLPHAMMGMVEIVVVR